MASISPKLFQNAIKGLKTTLFTTLTMELMLSSSGALGSVLCVAADVAALRVGDADSLSAAWANGSSLVLQGGFNINTGEDGLNIAGVDINSNANQTFTVAHDNITIGGNLDMNLVLDVAAGAVTVGSVGVGDVRVAGGVLSIADAGRDVIITGGQVNQSGAIGDDLTVSGGSVLLRSVSPVIEMKLRSSKRKQVKNVGTDSPVIGRNLRSNKKKQVRNVGTDSPVIEMKLRSSKKKQVKNVRTEADVGGTVTVQADAGAVTINNVTGNVTVAGGTLKIVDAGANMTITGGTVSQTGNIVGNLAMSNAAIFNSLAYVRGTVLLDNGFTGNATINNANGLVTIKGGTLTLDGAANGINFDGAAAAGTTVTVGAGGGVVNVDNTTSGDTIGTLTFRVGGTANNIGATNSLAVVNIGAGELTVNGAAMKADAVNLTDAASVLTLTNANAVLTGAIDNTTGGDNVGILNLNGASTQVTGDIGATKSLATVNIAAGATLQVGGNLAANNTSFGVGGILEFNDATAYAEHTFKGAIVNGANAKLNVNTNSLTTYDPSIGTVAQINIGAGNTFAIDANGGDVNVLAANIQFANQDAVLALRNSSNTNDRTITLAADIDPNNDDEGTVFLDSAEAGRKLTIAGGVTLGGAHKLKAIVFTGAGDFGMKGITFNTTDIKLNTTGVLELGATTANVTILNDAVKLTQTANIGGFLDFAGKNGTVTLNNGVNVVGAVQNTGGNSNGTLIALGASNLGSVNGIAMLKVGAGAVTIGGAGGDIKIGEIQGNGTALLTLPANFKLTGGFNKTGGQALKLSFANGSSVSDVVGTAANPVGDITLAGTNSFANTVNSNGVMTLAKGSVTTFAKDVKATSFVANGATMEFDGNLALNGNITGSGTTLDLGANQVTYTGTGSFTDALTLDTIFDGAAKSGGNILIKSGSTLDLSGVSNLNIVLNPVNFNIDPNTKYTLISAEAAGGLKPASASNVKFTVNGQNQFIKFTIDTSTLTLTLFATDATNEVIAQEFTGVTQQSLGLMANAVAGSYSRQTLDNWNSITNAQTVDAVGHVIQNIVKPSETVAACNQAVSGNILGNLTSINARIDKTQAAAMAAGDEDMNAQFGGWINPFIGNATQKKIQNISGYKSDTTGGTLGFDALINDDAVLGLAYTRAETDVKMKDAKQGDKNKVRSNIFSLYGLYNLPQSNLFVEGVASYGDSKVTSKARRIVAVAPVTLGYQTATGKYKLENYTGQLMAGYNYALPETVSAMPLVVTPMAGVRYSDIKDKGYKETGTTSQNLIVKGKSYNTFDGLAGAKLSSSLNVGEVALTPELYAMVDYAFRNKAPAIDARLQGMTAPFPTSSFKPKKTSFDLGAGVTIKHNMVEYGVNYDANIGNKYFAQQGSVKVRVNF
ncbi:MAG: autotransporter outer membrane beta-barrel domain-containing protein [Rickettsia endosymbiont of Pentastiridius leporinus]